MEELLQSIEEMIQELQRVYKAIKRELPKRLKTYESIKESKRASTELKTIAVVAKSNDHADLSRVSGQIAILRTIQILAAKMGILKKQLDESGILEKAKDIEDIKNLKSILKSVEAKKQKAEQNHRKDLSYIC